MDVREVAETSPVAMETTISSLNVEPSCRGNQGKQDIEVFSATTQQHLWAAKVLKNHELECVLTSVNWPAVAGRSCSALAWHWRRRWSGWQGQSSPRKTGTQCSPESPHRGRRGWGHSSIQRRWREQRAVPGPSETTEDGHCLRTGPKKTKKTKREWMTCLFSNTSPLNIGTMLSRCSFRNSREKVFPRIHDRGRFDYRSCASGHLWCLWGRWRSSDELNSWPSSPPHVAAASEEKKTAKLRPKPVLFVKVSTQVRTVYRFWVFDSVFTFLRIYIVLAAWQTRIFLEIRFDKIITCWHHTLFLNGERSVMQSATETDALWFLVFSPWVFQGRLTLTGFGWFSSTCRNFSLKLVECFRGLYCRYEPGRKSVKLPRIIQLTESVTERWQILMWVYVFLYQGNCPTGPESKCFLSTNSGKQPSG